MSKSMRMALCVFAALISLAVNAADELSGDEMRSLDEQVQLVKSDVLGISADLHRLEEKLLYPTNTQVAVFVALDGADTLRLDAVEVEIDSELVATYIYSFKELEALQKGGVQRLYTGNLTTGEHLLNVSYSGKLDNGTEVSASREFTFAKGVEPRILGLTVTSNGSGSPAIVLGDW